MHTCRQTALHEQMSIVFETLRPRVWCVTTALTSCARRISYIICRILLTSWIVPHLSLSGAPSLALLLPFLTFGWMDLGAWPDCWVSMEFLNASFSPPLFTNPVVKSLSRCHLKLTRVAVGKRLAFLLESTQSCWVVQAVLGSALKDCRDFDPEYVSGWFGTGSNPINNHFYWHTHCWKKLMMFRLHFSLTRDDTICSRDTYLKDVLHLCIRFIIGTVSIKFEVG